MRHFLVMAAFFVGYAPHVGAQDPIADDPWIFQGDEALAQARCQANFNRGAACQTLVDRLCSRIGDRRRECRRLRVEECHETNREHQSEEEASCQNGAHTGPCYGVQSHCRAQEYAYCRVADFGPRYCKFYFWSYCRNVVGVDSGGEFKTQRCRIFNNKEMIAFHESKVAEAIRWDPRGENTVRNTIAALEAERDALQENLRAMRQQRSSLVSQLQSAVGSIFDQLRRQLDELDRKIAATERQLVRVVAALDDHYHMRGLCRVFSPFDRG